MGKFFGDEEVRSAENVISAEAVSVQSRLLDEIFGETSRRGGWEQVSKMASFDEKKSAQDAINDLIEKLDADDFDTRLAAQMQLCQKREAIPLMIAKFEEIRRNDGSVNMLHLLSKCLDTKDAAEYLKKQGWLSKDKNSLVTTVYNPDKTMEQVLQLSYEKDGGLSSVSFTTNHVSISYVIGRDKVERYESGKLTDCWKDCKLKFETRGIRIVDANGELQGGDALKALNQHTSFLKAMKKQNHYYIPD